jgi:hypothetical protein
MAENQERLPGPDRDYEDADAVIVEIEAAV